MTRHLVRGLRLPLTAEIEAPPGGVANPCAALRFIDGRSAPLPRIMEAVTMITRQVNSSPCDGTHNEDCSLSLAKTYLLLLRET